MWQGPACAIDLFAGPTEIAIIADGTADAEVGSHAYTHTSILAQWMTRHLDTCSSV